MRYKILIFGASYGSLLVSKLLFGGDFVTLVCLSAEADLINRDGFRVRTPIRGSEPVLIGSRREDLVPFEKCADAARSLARPASVARALNNGALNVECADKLVQLIARQKNMAYPPVDQIVDFVDKRLAANRLAQKQAKAASA